MARILSGVAAAALAITLCPAPTEAAGAAVSAVRIRDTQLDPSALYFVSYDGLVNNDSFQQSGILSYAGYQYAAWYTADRSATIARRAGLGDTWQTITLPHKLTADDSHNVISMGISPQDGRLHVAMDTHGNQVYYAVSVAGLVSTPGSHAWTSAAFGPVQRTLNGVDLGAITYPQFVVTPERTLQLSYRTGTSGNGTNELAEYNAGTWRKLGKWSSATGSWVSGNGVTSTTRNMYLHGITYGINGRLYAAFTWREGNMGVLCNQGGLSNHDTGYVYSDDRGRTWRNNAGTVVGTTGGSPVAVDTPGTVVDPLGVDHGLMNQESQAVDSAGNPHVVISYVPGRFTQCVTNYSAQRKANGRTFFLSRTPGGSWTKQEVPVAPQSTQRTKLVLDRADNAYLVMPYGRIVAATKASGWTDWTTVHSPDLNAFGEVDVDDSRLATEGVISVMYQQNSTGTAPSPIRVADFELG